VERGDIAPIAGYLGLTEHAFIEKHLVEDKEESECFVMNKKPCGFLLPDGMCDMTGDC
jgi:hypothetical protein